MTYNDILETIQNMSEREREQTASVFVPGVDEVFEIGDLRLVSDDEEITDTFGENVETGKALFFIR